LLPLHNYPFKYHNEIVNIILIVIDEIRITELLDSPPGNSLLRNFAT
jgi:hypothetical protein